MASSANSAPVAAIGCDRTCGAGIHAGIGTGIGAGISAGIRAGIGTCFERLSAVRDVRFRRAAGPVRGRATKNRYT
jgi:hypothetical protein